MANSPDSLNVSTLIASAVHDIKNALSIILNELDELSEDGSIPPEQMRIALKQLSFEGKRLNNDLIQMLALYRIGNGQYSINAEEHEVYDLLEEACLENQHALANKNINIQIECDEDLMWFFDRPLLLGIINATINNAYRHAQEAILLQALIENNQLVIKILDDGPGYPQHILAPSDDQPTISFTNGNTGLGLHFATIVAQAHKNANKSGNILLSNSGINGGGSFAIYLP